MPSLSPEFKELHNNMLVALKEFDKLCKVNDIEYSLHGGTLLGAVRERGFIPWDDDIDVTLSRQEYEKLVKIIETQQSNFVISRIAYHNIALLCNVVEDSTPCWIDIFIYDYISENKFARFIKIYCLAALLCLSKTKETIEVTKLGRYKGAKYYAGCCLYVVGKIIPMTFKTQFSHWFSEHCFNGKCEFVFRSNDQYMGIILVLPKSIIEKFDYVRFEDANLRISKDYRIILESSYGNDFMIPKPPDKFEVDGHNLYKKIYSNA